MLTKIYENPAVYRVDVPLPDNPLKNLNCYVVQDSGETLIIDTGFNRKECLDALLEGLAELDADWEKTNLFLTHLHADHTGLAPTLMYAGCHLSDSGGNGTFPHHPRGTVPGI